MRCVESHKGDRAEDDPYQQPKPEEPRRPGSAARLVRDRRRGLLLTSVEVASREILLLPVHAVDRARSSFPQRHENSHRREVVGTLATGSENEVTSRPRSLARGWEAPCDRLGNRPPASQETHLFVGRVEVIGVSLLSNPTYAKKRDR
jgi:hypothetical protein